MKEHKKATEAEDTALNDLRAAFCTDKWMAACWGVIDGKLVMCRTTSEFPREQFTAAINMLRRDLEKENQNHVMLRQLPLAPHIVEENLGEEE